MKNPFKYGVVVTGDDFVDRELELEELKRDLLSGKSVILYSQRQMGKSSLIAEVFRRLDKDAMCFKIDMYGIGSREALAEELIRGTVTSAYTTLEKMRRAVAEFLRTLRVNIVLAPDGSVKFEIAKGVALTELSEAFDFPEKVARDKKKPMVVAFDEFQEIGLLDGIELEKLMRSKFQYHKNVAYVFAGSKRHMLQEIFSEEARAFYKFGKPMSLGVIAREEFAQFISKKFKRGGGSISEDAVGMILDVTGGHPYFTQQLCYELWFISSDVKGASLVDETVERILAHQQVSYLNIWDSLPQLQRNLLVGLAREESPSIYSAEFVERYQLKTQSHVKRAFELLERKGIIDEGKIVDIFFREWLKKRSP